MAVTTGTPRRCARLSVTLLLFAMLTTLLPVTPAQADDRSTARIQTLVERKVNRARVARGLRPLKVQGRLEYWATDHARYLARNRTLVHDSVTRLFAEGPPRTLIVAENIGRNRSANAAKRAHRMFMRSPSHRVNVLHPGMTHMGIGVVKRGRSTYVVQRFAKLP